jgi:hypothetical protein
LQNVHDNSDDHTCAGATIRAGIRQQHSTGSRASAGTVLGEHVVQKVGVVQVHDLDAHGSEAL